MTDLISREAAIAAMQQLLEKEAFGSAFRVPFLDAIGALQELPSAEVFAELDKASDILAGRRMESLGAEFEAVWDANPEKLYEP